MAPRVTESDIDAAIRNVLYDVLSDEKTTVCSIVLDNGFTVRGESSCVCKENFNAEMGRTIAYKNARERVWQFLGFRLADTLLMRDTFGNDDGC